MKIIWNQIFYFGAKRMLCDFRFLFSYLFLSFNDNMMNDMFYLEEMA
jgi:hypothetical protein